MIALPSQLFYSTQIPACLWFLARDRHNGRFRDRRGEVLFIDARRLGQMIDRTHRELTDEDIARISDTYHAWRGEEGAGAYEDIHRCAPLFLTVGHCSWGGAEIGRRGRLPVLGSEPSRVQGTQRVSAWHGRVEER